jgi:hypothetical protein
MTRLPTNRQLGRTVEAEAARADMSVRRHRRWIAVNALIEIFHIAQQRGIIPCFIVKGGFALEFRFRTEARASRDVDVVVPVTAEEILDAVVEVLRLEWSGFTFQINGRPELRDHSYRLQVTTQCQNQDWSTFDLELVFADVAGHDTVPPLDLATYGLLTPSGIPCMTIAEQVAQKLHAATDPGENRPRDLIDIYLGVTRLPPGYEELREACIRTFSERKAHDWPPAIEIRDGWSSAQLAGIIASSDLDLSVEEVFDGVRSLVARLAVSGT